MAIDFKITQRSNGARLGEIHTPHGVIHTPAFIFCATKAAIKAVDIERVAKSNTQVILSNTYHLMLQPGEDVIAKLGGLHKFMNWNGPMLTDSGGYQIFSLGHGSVAEEIKGVRNNTKRTLIKITEDGAIFRSYIDGRTYFLTPERSIEIQQKLGADLIVVLDECTPFHVSKEYTRKSMLMSHNWAKRSLVEFQKNNTRPLSKFAYERQLLGAYGTENRSVLNIHEDLSTGVTQQLSAEVEFQKWAYGTQALYGIVQGGVYEDLRTESCDFVNDMPFFGHAIGGSLGSNKQQMYEIVTFTASKLTKDRPIHLLGIGGIEDIFHGVELGIDTFDCVHPTRLARHGGALVKTKNRDSCKEHLNLRNQRFKLDDSPIEGDCLCFTCEGYSRAYIHHLLKAKELLAYSLITIHNIYFMNNLMASIRAAIINNTLKDEKEKWV